MSKSLKQFQQSYQNFVNYNVELTANLAKSHLILFLNVNMEKPDFSETCWATLDNKTLAEFKALSIYAQINKTLMPLLYPEVSFEPGKAIPIDVLLNPRKLTPLQLSQAFDAIKDITENALQETIANRTCTEVLLNLLKTCVNFLITLVTFGQKQDTFKSSTFHLEKIKKIQEDMHTILEKLNEDEKKVELDKPEVPTAYTSQVFTI
ncbi:hypothetical protein [Legionella cardiaca]|uniref:Uncharacterized protein n=1 Tax=Legionella cardiaca TaxID=1071983 RepID=A0ABY8AP55_9GAMM|nr:hypothetical protein [Legionella cardiaca]WED42484.1 hypothetical protein PXX05_11235 [Legionella cardiaca]